MSSRRSASAVGFRTAGMVTALCLLAAGLAACGSGSGQAAVASIDGSAQPSPQASAASKKTREAALLDFAKCMRANGVTNFPDPTVDAEGNPRLDRQGLDRNDPAAQKAQRACQSKLADARPSFNPEQRQELQDALLAYAKCMRSNGYNMADPAPGSGPGRGGPFGNVNRNDPAFKKADTVCRSKLGDLGNGGPGAGPPGGPPPG